MPLLPLRWRVFLAALVIIASVLAAAWAANPPVYFTNDDVTIRLALEGRAIPGQPATGFSLLTHAALGWSVVALNRAVPAIPWWDLIVAGTLVWALAIFVATAWDALGPGWLARTTAVSALFVAAAPLTGGLQFTISATLAGGAAVLVGVLELAAFPRRRRSVLLMSATLLLAGLLVRTLAAAAGAAAVVIFVMPMLWQDRRRAALALGLAAAAALIVAVQYADALLYSVSGEWDTYYRYNWMVVRLFEWGGELPARDTDAVRASVEWSRNDWMMLEAFFGVDRAVHGVDQVSRAYETRAALVGWEGLLAWVSARVRTIDGIVMRRLLAESAIVLAAIAAACAHARRGGAVRAAAMLLLFAALCLAIEAFFKELPFRVLAPMQLCLVAAVLVAIGAFRRAPSPLVSVIALGALAALVASQLGATISAAAAEHRHTLQVVNEVKALQRLSPALLVLHADTFPREHWWRPFHRPDLDISAIALGWNNQNPLLQEFLSASGRDPLLKTICSDPAILVVAEEGRLDFVTTYLQEHYNAAVRWQDVYAGSFRAWRCAPS